MQQNIVGMDEVGRGALAGPVCVAAFGVRDLAEVTKSYHSICGPTLKDSKLLSKSMREKVVQELTGDFGIGYGWSKPAEIDRLGIIEAIRLASEQAYLNYARNNPVTKVILDQGLPKPKSWDGETIQFPKADQKELVVALASIFAKVARDHQMVELSHTYPGYAWECNVGYGTQAHLEAIRQIGPSKEHRQTFLKP